MDMMAQGAPLSGLDQAGREAARLMLPRGQGAIFFHRRDCQHERRYRSSRRLTNVDVINRTQPVI